MLNEVVIEPMSFIIYHFSVLIAPIIDLQSEPMH